MTPSRRKSHAPANHDRWLISYADFITLLFAFFVVMFASSQTDKRKAQQMSDSIRSALGKDKISSAIAGILGGTPGVKGRGNAQMKGPGGQQKITAQHPDASAHEVAAKVAELLPSLHSAHAVEAGDR
jgi:chemotaxis protein MotB